MASHVNVGRRLDSVPIGKFHRRLIVLVGLGMFFDSFDNNISSGVLASMLPENFSTLEKNSTFLSVTFAGLAAGAALAGWLSDRFGRSFAFHVSLGLFGIVAVAAAAAPNIEILIVMRFIMSVGMGAEYVICYGMITEFVPKNKRGRYLGMLGIFAGFGVALASVLSWIIIPLFTWRAMFIIGGVGALITWWMRRGMPESPRWLVSQGRDGEAEDVIKEIERGSGIYVEDPPSDATGESDGTDDEEKTKWVPISVLFSRPVIWRTLMALLLAISCMFGSYTVTGWMPTFFVEQGMEVAQSLGFNAAMMCGYVAGPLLLVFITDRFGRRRTIMSVGLLGTIFAAVYPFMEAPWMVMLIGFVLVACAASFLTLCLGTVAEFFPTAYRFRAGGFAQTVGRLGLIVSPFVVLWLYSTFDIFGVILAISILYLSVTVIYGVARLDTSPRVPPLDVSVEEGPRERYASDGK